MNEIADIFKRVRLKKGYSQEYMAAELKINRSTYSRIENGKCSCNLDRFLLICFLLNIDLNFVWGNRDCSFVRENNDFLLIEFGLKRILNLKE